MECPRGVGSSVISQLLAVGDPELLADQVDAGGLLGDRVLDLQPGVDLEEGDRCRRRRPGTPPCRRRGSRPPRQMALAEAWIRARCSSVRNGAGASSTSFWWRRCSEQSRVPTTITLPCGVGQHLRLDVPGLVQVPLDEALAAAERGDRLADGGVEQLGDLLHRAGDLQPAAAAAERGLDGDRQAVLLGEGDDLVGVRPPGPWCRAPAARRPWWRCAGRSTLSPRSRIACGDGPIQVSPASMTAWAKSAFSDRKP